MASLNNGGNNRSFEGNTSLPTAAGSTIPLLQQFVGELNTPNPVFHPATIPIAINLLHVAFEAPKLVTGQPSQQEKKEHLVSKELASKFLLVSSKMTLCPTSLQTRKKFPMYSLMKKVKEFYKGVRREVPLLERSIPFRLLRPTSSGRQIHKSRRWIGERRIINTIKKKGQ
ncbi:UNVERIFIED_CONTAM: hypothetical protein Sradi_5702700 [Sesamum radiatum]|uniref:Uncharacterized protein n=1 Tax=Sesamum radiatum TaxID=300843 RepID=A0AAW2L0X6_SESRA